MIQPLKAYLNSYFVGILVIALTWLAFFGRVISGKYIYFLDDLKILYYPLEVAYANFQQVGQLPLWSPLFGFGQPLLAWGQLGYFTPLHFFLRALAIDTINLLQISIVSYFAVGLLGFFLFLSQHKLDNWAAVLGATVFTFSGFNIGHLNHVNFYVGTMVVPWLLVAITAFVRRPSAPRAAAMALTAAIIALSAQPQITLYMFCIAAIFGIIAIHCWRPLTNKPRSYIVTLALTFLSAGLTILLSSLAILPLAEFLPVTDRSADLPVEELLDFSYPPSHAITLIAPYFFGDHTSYWGAKGFQELAAFTGILPLLLAGVAVTRWRNYRHFRLFGIVLVLIGIIMALGRFSPIYAFLVTHHILTTLNIPGRFVFFFTTGIAILSAVGVNDIINYRAGQVRFWAARLMPLLIFFIIGLPFARRLSEPALAVHAKEIVTDWNSAILLAIIGLAAFYLALSLAHRTNRRRPAGITLYLLTTVTLIIFGYDYSPVAARDSFYNSLPFAEPLVSFSQHSGLPARLYSRDILLDNLPFHKVIATQPLTPRYTVFQPVTIADMRQPCFIIPMQAATPEGTIEVSLLPSLNAAPIDTVTINAYKTLSQSEQRVCFSVDSLSSPTDAVLRFSSQSYTTVRLATYPVEELSAYLVRTQNPSPAIIAASQKPYRIDLSQDLSRQYDNEAMLLARHIQVVGNTSSARWIGALSIKSFREFIEKFLANDDDYPFTSDGLHIIEANRLILDMLGVTHLAQRLPPDAIDGMPPAGYRIVAEAKTGFQSYRLYENPAAFPKAWLVPSATFSPSADDTRHAISSPSFNPRQQIYISGPTPPSPAELATGPLESGDEPGKVNIISYQPTHVTLSITTPRDTWLVLSDTTTPQWQTFVDQKLAPYYVANSFMKAAFIPAGQHNVSFIYYSPATKLAVILTVLGFGLFLACYFIPLTLLFYRGSSRSQVGMPPQTS